MIQTTAVLGTAREIIEYLQINEDGSEFWLTRASSPVTMDAEVPENPLSPEEMEALLDEAGRIGEGRTDPSRKYDRKDIYFDR